MRNLEANNLDVIIKTKGTLPRVPFALIKKEILKDEYELSISFVSESQMEKLSQEWKGNKTHKNILSFPFSKTSGEIIMSLSAARIEAVNFGRNFENHVIFLVIHGMLHLAGYTHGSKMESKEKLYMSKFTK